MQLPVHRVLQQTPWAQKPEVQSVPAMHAAPIGFFPQLPITHRFGARHSAAVEQLV
jgi:hypothetical protein